jgi:hypothetical protein
VLITRCFGIGFGESLRKAGMQETRNLNRN